MAEIDTCYICRKPIIDDHSNCAYCGTAFHKSELNNWIKRFNKCPRCERELKKFVII